VYYNSRLAYPGLGFEKIIYADKFTPTDQESISVGDQIYLFDGDLFRQNLVKVKTLLQAGQPFLNYLVTMYGHWPFDIDIDRHPLLIEVQPDEEDLKRLSNLFYYRTKALFQYIKNLQELDPQGIIVLVSDHLPPLSKGILDYQRLDYRGRGNLSGTLNEYLKFDNFLLVIADGQVQKLPRMRHFDLPHWILDRLSHGKFCQDRDCDFGRLPIDPKKYLDHYRTIMGLAGRSKE
jgi:hypothetical protein